jgi:hypothetical protein
MASPKFSLGQIVATPGTSQESTLGAMAHAYRALDAPGEALRLAVQRGRHRGSSRGRCSLRSSGPLGHWLPVCLVAPVGFATAFSAAGEELAGAIYQRYGGE